METRPKRRKLWVFRHVRSTASWKNFPWQRKPPSATLFGAKAASLFIALLLLGISIASSQTAPIVEPAPRPAQVQLYASADENSLQVGLLLPGENFKPIAESRGTGGIKWYLVKSQSGIVGWVKYDHGEQSKKIEHFFRSLPAEPNRVSAEISIGSASAAPRGAVVVPIHFSGRSAVVPVIFNHSVTANLVLDTGAAVTMISPRVAASLRVPFAGSGYITGVGGTVPTQIVRVDSVKVGDSEVTDMPIAIHDPFRNASFEGLLGMDFLGRFQIAVDPVKRLLRLTPH